MKPVYRDHPLLESERADLAAYLGSPGSAPSDMTLFVICLGIWVMTGLSVLFFILWHRRLGRVRASLEQR